METLPIISKDQEIADLKKLLEKTRQQLESALNEIVRFKKPISERGEPHHRAFERICPMPPELENLSVKPK